MKLPEPQTILTFRQKIARILQSKKFKRVMFVIGILILLLSGFIAVSPATFLRFGYPGIFVICALGGSSLLLIPLTQFFNVFGLAFAAASGMAVNDSIAWIIGSSGTAVIERPPKLKKIERTVERYGVFAIFFWSLLPFPYDLVGFVAGYLGLSYPRYIIPTFLGKFIRFTLIGLGLVSLT